MRESETQQHTGAESVTWADTQNDIMSTPLPSELQQSIQRLLGTSSVTTLTDWVQEVRAQLGGGSIRVEDLCHVSEPTAHRAEVDGETYHFRCFYDAVVLAALTEKSVEIFTRSPAGSEIEATAIGTDSFTVRPESAVTSFGVSGAATRRDGHEPSLKDVYQAVCPYVKAFPDDAAYRQWAADIDAPTIAMPLEEATAMARALGSESI